MKITDFHTHTFPDAIAERAIAGMQQNSHAKAFGTGTLTGLLDSMEQAGIARSVILPVATNPLKIASGALRAKAFTGGGTLTLGSAASLYVPSASGGNWAWKLDELPDLSSAKRLAALVKEYDRINSL